MVYDLGIDVGTSYTAAAVARPDGTVEVVGLGPIADNTPTVIYLGDDGTLVMGDAANRRAVIDPAGAAREFKRRVGDPTPMILRSSPFSAEGLMGRMVDYVIARVADRERDMPRRATVTHPANWGPYKLELFEQALRPAGLTTVSRLSEPHAAALAYATEARVGTGSLIAVYDLGGGTFDAAVLRKSDDGFELLGDSVGIEHLGGVDFDEAVLHHVRTTIGDRWPSDPDDPSLPAPMLHLRRACMEAKELLSSEQEVAIPVLLPGVDATVPLSRRQFEAMIAPRIDDSISALETAVASAGLTPAQLDTILLVGGSSRIPLVGRMLRDRFGDLVAVDVDPLYAVARGAAIAARDRGDRAAGVSGPSPQSWDSSPASGPLGVGAGGPAGPGVAPVAGGMAAAAAMPPAAAAGQTWAEAASPPAPAAQAATAPGPAPAVPPVWSPPAGPPPAGMTPGSAPVPPLAEPGGGAPARPGGDLAATGHGAGRPADGGPPLPGMPPPGGSPPPPGGEPPPMVGAFVSSGRDPRRNLKRLLIPVLVIVLLAGAVGAYALTRPDDDAVAAGDEASATTAGGQAAVPAGSLPAGVNMSAVPAGSYPLGVEKPEPNAAETLLQRVSVAAFHIDRFEVSNEDYKRFVDEAEAAPPLSWGGGRYPADRAKHPVMGVNYEWASAYCAALSKRLPTETEWEVAGRGAEGLLYPWGNDPAAVQLPAGSDTYPVGSVEGNKSPFGVYDLVGNVWEWVADSYDKRVPATARVLRGGQNGWLRKASTRLPVDPQASNALTIAGFRCAASEVDPDRTDASFGEYAKPPPPAAPTPKPLPEGVLTQDEFDDATSGWVEKSSEKFRFGYHPNGFFHLETKVANAESMALGPVVPEPGKALSVSTSAFVEPNNTDAGGTFDYGLAFRMDEQGKGLIFVVGSRTSDWKVCNRNPDGTYAIVAQSNRSIPEIVDLEVRILPGDIYEFRIGGNVVHRRTIPGYGGTGTGMVLLSYANSKKAHIHFDRFAMSHQV